MDWFDDYLNALSDPGRTVNYPPDTYTWRPARPNQQQKSMINDSMAFDQQQQMRIIEEARRHYEEHGGAPDAGSVVWPRPVQLFDFAVTTTSGAIFMQWSDGTSDTLSSGVTYDHSFFCPSSPAAPGFWNNIQPCITY